MVAPPLVEEEDEGARLSATWFVAQAWPRCRRRFGGVRDDAPSFGEGVSTVRSMGLLERLKKTVMRR